VASGVSSHSRSERRLTQAETLRPTGDLRRVGRRALGWQSLSTFVVQSAQALTTVVVAGVVGPASFAIWGIASILLNARVVLTLGFGEALVYFDPGRRLRDYVDTAFVATAVLAGAVSAGLIVAAPAISSSFGAGFDEGDLTLALRLTAIAFAFSALETIPLAIIERTLELRRRALSEVAIAVAYVAAALLLLAAGAGIWSIVLARLGMSAARFARFWVIAPVRPRMVPHADRESLRRLIGFGAFLNAAAILGFAAENLDTLLIASVGSVEEVGAYALAFTIANLVPTFVGFTLNPVALPVFAAVRDVPDTLRRAFAAALHLVAVAMFPTTAVLLFIAPEAITGILGEDWAAAATFVQILAVYALARATGDTAIALLSGTGHPQAALVARALGLSVSLALLWPLSGLGVEGVAWAFTGGRIAVATYAVYQARRALSRRVLGVWSVLAAATLAVVVSLVAGSRAPGAAGSMLEIGVFVVTFSIAVLILDPWLRERLLLRTVQAGGAA
jgi:PST family polysaccharide transporter